jgi:ATP-binding cassette subfamily A (ABC1) protein 3
MWIHRYWLTALVWDYLTSLVPFVIFLIIFAAFKLPEFEGDNLGIVFLVLLVFAWAAIPCVYCLTFLFKVGRAIHLAERLVRVAF